MSSVTETTDCPRVTSLAQRISPVSLQRRAVLQVASSSDGHRVDDAGQSESADITAAVQKLDMTPVPCTTRLTVKSKTTSLRHQPARRHQVVRL